MMSWLRKERLAGWGWLSNPLVKRLDWTTANWVCVFHLALTPIYAGLFLLGQLAAGATVYAIAVFLDFVDGALARHQEDQRRDLKERLGEVYTEISFEEESALSLSERLNWRGKTHLGKSLDPFVDKCTFYAALLPLADERLPLWLVLTNLSLAILLTFSRPILRLVRKADGSANRFGKAKMWTEILVISALVLIPPSFDNSLVATGLLVLATVLASVSLGAQFYIALRPTST